MTAVTNVSLALAVELKMLRLLLLLLGECEVVL